MLPISLSATYLLAVTNDKVSLKLKTLNLFKLIVLQSIWKNVSVEINIWCLLVLDPLIFIMI